MGWACSLMAGLSVGAAPVQTPLVEAAPAVQGLAVALRYTTADNFLHRPLYPEGARCLLRPEAVAALAKATEQLRAHGFRPKAWDCYRPRSVQWQMWKAYPHPGYVADPRYGSNHNRGAAIDLTLVDLAGEAVEMPTDFDSFTPAAHQGYAGGSAASRQHRELLKEAMVAAGFRPNRMEWWHFDLPGARAFPVLDVPFVSSR